MARILKFGIKAGILGGVVYYSKDIGIWKDSDTTYELWRKGISFLTPYVNKLEKEVPIPAELKNLPSTADACRTISTYWNKGVISSIAFLERVPRGVSCYINQGISYVSSQIQQEKALVSSGQESSSS